MEYFWEFINSGAGQSLIHAIGVLVAAWLVGKIISKKPEWEKYIGTLTFAIKQAEQMIPDDHPNKNYARFDTAMKIAVDALEKREVSVSKALIESFKQGIDMVHRDMEVTGKIPSRSIAAEPELDD